MKINLRWQFLLALTGFIFVLALLSYQVQVQTTSYCTVTEAAEGGTFVEGMVGTPQYLNPLLSDNNPVDRELVSLIFDGLTRRDANGRLLPALADSWEVSEDGLSVVFSLRDDVIWQDGEPFSAEDVAFTYGLMQSDEFPNAGLRALWQTVTITVIDVQTVQFTLEEPYAPFLDATTRGILPVHLLEGVTAVSLPDQPFNATPIGTGPLIVEGGVQNGRLRFLPNPVYWQQAHLDAIEFRFFPNETSLLDAFTNGEIQAINNVSPVMLPQIAELPQTRLFTSAAPRFTELLFNLGGTEAPALGRVDVRQALAYALNRDLMVDEVLNGQAVPLEGPYLPTSWAYNPPLLTQYDFAPETAVALLNAAGWTLPEGQTVRQQEEESLILRLLFLDTSTFRALATAVQQQWAEVGVGVTLQPAASYDELLTALIERDFDVALLEVRPSGDPDLYDFWSQ
ncbi:MAG: peptide ABC transporter substrate-binding protein, partial [Anaerolineales bacterium]|nr:peptide ABC transporter substrate-binding protein [Anaerolineales bacterium]